MKFLIIFLQVLILYGIFLLGEFLQRFFDLPLPGSIIGLLVLWLALLLKIFPLKWIESGSYFLLSYLPLYFIPATVGVMEYGHVFLGKGFLLIPITIISTFLTLWLSGVTSQYIAKRKERVSCK
jgi:holin-like protein